MNGYAELLIAIYLTAVLIAKKETQLSAELVKESGFIKWAIALGLVIVITGQFGKTGAQFMSLVWIALLMTAVDKNPELLDAFTKMLGSK